MKKPAVPETVTARTLTLDLKVVEITIKGTSALIVHAWSAKAKRQMLDKQMKKASPGRAVKDPVGDFRETLYPMPNGNGYGFPTIGFKAAAVDAANMMELKKTEMRAAFHILGERVKIEAPPLTEPVTESDQEYWEEIKEEREYGVSMRSDMVRVGMGTADIRFRAQFPTWLVKLRVQFNASVISLEQIVNLFNIAGFGIGVGEHRPQKDGSNGTFQVA